MTKAFAAVSNGNILVDTVSSTDRAAMVNWLVTKVGFMVPQGMGDFAIRDHFERLSTQHDVKVEPVEVTFA